MKYISALGFLMLLTFFACQPQAGEPYQPTPYELPTPLYFPTHTNIPADNPMTEEGVALGKLLFSGSHLSPLNAHPSSCASCHHQEYSYEMGPEGTLDHLGTQHTM